MKLTVEILLTHFRHDECYNRMGLSPAAHSRALGGVVCPSVLACSWES